jgi:hypothetical protein
MGKLGFRKFVREPMRLYPQHHPMPRPPWDITHYGIGLKEAKDFTENYLSRKTTTATT